MCYALTGPSTTNIQPFMEKRRFFYPDPQEVEHRCGNLQLLQLRISRFDIKVPQHISDRKLKVQLGNRWSFLSDPTGSDWNIIPCSYQHQRLGDCSWITAEHDEARRLIKYERAQLTRFKGFLFWNKLQLLFLLILNAFLLPPWAVFSRVPHPFSGSLLCNSFTTVWSALTGTGMKNMESHDSNAALR